MFQPESPDIPYIDLVLQTVAGRGVPREFHIHYGYWDDPSIPATREGHALGRIRLVDSLLEHLALGPGGTALDVGCGVGGTVARMDARYDDVTLIGLNIDRRQLEAAAHLLGGTRNTVQWLCADACAIPLPDASIDGAISIEALPHFASRLTALREMGRVLRSGARFAFADLTSSAAILDEHPIEERDQWQARFEQGFGPWPELWQPVDYGSLARDAGMKMISNRDVTANVLPSTQWLVAPGPGAVARAVNASTDRLTRWMETGAVVYRLVVLERR